MAKHKIKDKTREYRQFDDCTLYRIYCTCGKECGGWTPQKAEEDFIKHMNEESTPKGKKVKQ